MLERFLFSPTLQWSPIGKLSGGERRRLYLLRTLMGEPNVLLLDEPTNDLDIQTLTILEDYLDQFPGAVITVSHDRYFLDRTVSHLFAFDGKGQIEPYIGNYSDYLEEKQEQAEADQNRKELIRHASSSKSNGGSNTASAAVISSPATTGGTSNANRPKKLTFKEQKEWDEIESTIASLEDKAASLKKQIEAAGSDFDRVRDLYEQEQQTTLDLEAAMERWTYLSELLEEIERNK
jgi:ATP-binding cassette subfamily F protein uup